MRSWHSILAGVGVYCAYNGVWALVVVAAVATGTPSDTAIVVWALLGIACLAIAAMCFGPIIRACRDEDSE